MKKLLFTMMGFTLALSVAMSGCSNPNFPFPGFTVTTVRISSLGIDVTVPGVEVSGFIPPGRPPGTGYTGNRSEFPNTFSSYPSALIPVANGIAPAFWRLTAHSGPRLRSGDVTVNLHLGASRIHEKELITLRVDQSPSSCHSTLLRAA